MVPPGHGGPRKHTFLRAVRGSALSGGSAARTRPARPESVRMPSLQFGAQYRRCRKHADLTQVAGCATRADRRPNRGLWHFL